MDLRCCRGNRHGCEQSERKSPDRASIILMEGMAGSQDARVGYSKRRGFMNLRHSKSLLNAAVLAGLGLAIASGQTQDTSGNGLLNGKYEFRHIAIQAVQNTSPGGPLNRPAQITASYGLITVDGAGKYTITGTSVDNTVSGGAAQALNVTGTYAIGSNGAGYVSSPLYPTGPNLV